jgi:hypothetical protein
MNKKIIAVIAILLTAAFSVTPTFAAGLMCNNTVIRTGAATANYTNTTWNSTLTYSWEARLNDTGDKDVKAAWVESNFTGANVLYPMTNSTPSSPVMWTLNITGIPASTGVIGWTILFNNTTSLSNCTSRGASNASAVMWLTVNKTTASIATSVTNAAGTAVTTLTAPGVVKYNCAVSRNTAPLTETLVPAITATLTYPDGNSRAVATSGWQDSLPAIGNRIYTFSCSQSVNGNYTTNATAVSNTLTMDAGGQPIVTGNPYNGGWQQVITTQNGNSLQSMLNTKLFGVVPVWLAGLGVVIAVLAKKKKLKL